MTGPDVPGQGWAAGREGGEAPPSHQSLESVLALSRRACANVTSGGLRKVPIATANPAPAPWPGSGQVSMDTASPAVQARRGLCRRPGQSRSESAREEAGAGQGRSSSTQRLSQTRKSVPSRHPRSVPRRSPRNSHPIPAQLHLQSWVTPFLPVRAPGPSLSF